MIKKCSKCDTEFKCEGNNIAQCHCKNVTLNSTQTKYLTQKYDDCLCANCLIEVTKIKI